MYVLADGCSLSPSLIVMAFTMGGGVVGIVMVTFPVLFLLLIVFLFTFLAIRFHSLRTLEKSLKKENIILEKIEITRL